MQLEVQSFYYYIKDHKVTYKIIETKWGQFCLVCGVLYLYHLVWTMAGVNAFASETRKLGCG